MGASLRALLFWLFFFCKISEDTHETCYIVDIYSTHLTLYPKHSSPSDLSAREKSTSSDDDSRPVRPGQSRVCVPALPDPAVSLHPEALEQCHHAIWDWRWQQRQHQRYPETPTVQIHETGTHRSQNARSGRQLPDLKPGLRSDQQTFATFFCLQQQTVPSLNDDPLANGHLSVMSSNTPLIGHGYFWVMNRTIWVSPSLFATANAPIFRLMPFSKCSLPTVVQWNKLSTGKCSIKRLLCSLV